MGKSSMLWANPKSIILSKACSGLQGLLCSQKALSERFPSCPPGRSSPALGPWLLSFPLGQFEWLCGKHHCGGSTPPR